MRRFPILAYSILAAAILATSFAQADTMYPKPGWKDKPNPIASPDAYVGGELVAFPGASPKSLNYLLDNNSFSAFLFGGTNGISCGLYESLLTLDPVTQEYRPGLANKWSISDDKKTFTFWINPKARWSDGKPITAQDAKWSFNMILNPKNMTGIHKVALERIESVKVLGPLQIQFRAKEVHWNNLGAVAGEMYVLPKHAYEGKDFNLVNFAFPVTSGLYRLDEVKEGVYVTLKRRPDYWNIDAPSQQGVGNFETLKFKFFESRENAFEAFLKGEIDIFMVNEPSRWAESAVGKRFDKNWIVKQRISNHLPIAFRGFAMNMRKPPFDDPRVRKAMALMVDRERMRSTLWYNEGFLLQSYWSDLYTQGRPCPNELIPFDKVRARALLAEAGWRANPKTGILEKDGKPFAFQFLSRSATMARYLNVYAEDLKDIGVQMGVEMKDWASWLKDMDTFNFQMTWASWFAGTFRNPEGMWHSKEAKREGGNNFTGLMDPRVDALIEEQKGVFDLRQRDEICVKIDRLIFEQHPYALLWKRDYVPIVYWNKFGTPPTVFSKFVNEDSACWYWWDDEDQAADLEDAMATDQALPAKPSRVQFDKEFQGE